MHCARLVDDVVPGVRQADLRHTLALELGFNGTSTTNYDKLLNYMWLDVVRGRANNADMLFNIKKMLVSQP